MTMTIDAIQDAFGLLSQRIDIQDELIKMLTGEVADLKAKTSDAELDVLRLRLAAAPEQAVEDMAEFLLTAKLPDGSQRYTEEGARALAAELLNPTAEVAPAHGA